MRSTFVFYSPKDVEETMTMLEKVIESMGGSSKRLSGSRLLAKWRTSKQHSQQYHTVFPSKCNFYVGQDMVRAVLDGSTGLAGVSMGFRLVGMGRVWNAFVESLTRMFPDMDFGIIPGNPSLDAVQIVGDGTEQVFTSTSWSRPSWGGAMLGGFLFGTPGAIVGGMGGSTHTVGKSTTRFSDKVLIKGRYTNGLVVEGEIYKKSATYQEIMVNMSRLTR